MRWTAGPSAAPGRCGYVARGGPRGLHGALRAEIARVGIHATVVNPGVFGTDLLTEQSTIDAEPSVADYDGRHGAAGGPTMSDYRWYKFVALCRPLSAKQMAELRVISTRAEITSTRF